MENEIEIVKSVGDTILEYNTDLITDITELGIDYIFEDSPFVELPIVKTIYSITKTGIAIRDRHMLNKTLIFINQLITNTLDSKSYEEYKEKIKKRDKKTFEELERVIIILDKFIEKEKAIILANLYSACLNKYISFSTFQNFAFVLDKFLLYDRTNLGMLYDEDRQLSNMEDKYGPTNRLISLGMAYMINGYSRNPITNNISFMPPKNDVAITDFGRQFYRYGFLNEKNTGTTQS